jgi:hypothetical protein
LNTLTFVSSATATDGTLQFDVGDVAGNVWIDGVQFFQQAPDIFERDFSDGVAVLNGTTGWQTVALEPGLQRFTGAQAPLYQYIVDDSSAGFSASGGWNVVNVSTGSFIAVGPCYNAWGGSLHELDVPQGTAQWNLSIPFRWPVHDSGLVAGSTGSSGLDQDRSVPDRFRRQSSRLSESRSEQRHRG